jgi:hypothetical protein
MKKCVCLFFLSFNWYTYHAQSLKALPCYDLSQVMKVEPTFLYKPHLDASKSFGVKLLQDSKDVQKYINNGKFHKIKKTGKGTQYKN